MKYKGVTIETERSSIAVEATAEAPDGMVFKGLGVHGVVANTLKPGTLKEMVALVKKDIDGGFEPCPDPHCDICHPENK